MEVDILLNYYLRYPCRNVKNALGVPLLHNCPKEKGTDMLVHPAHLLFAAYV